MYNIIQRKVLFNKERKESCLDAQLKKGLLEICILSAIEEEESYGYKIISDVAPYIEISESTLYPILRRLEASGSVTTRSAEYNGRLRKYFKITEIGKARINDFVDTIKEFNKISGYIVRKIPSKGEEM